MNYASRYVEIALLTSTKSDDVIFHLKSIFALDRLAPGQNVWVIDQKAARAVIGTHSTPHSYLVEGPHGIIRRNQQHLIVMQLSPEQSSSDAADEQPAAEQPIASPQQNIPETPSIPTFRTRSGRAVITPTLLDL